MNQVMNKRRVKAHQSEKLCWNERKILSLVDSPFVVCLKYAFTSKEDLFLILDLMRGGACLLKPTALPEQHTRSP